MAFLSDGKGRGNLAGVNEDNLLEVFAVTSGETEFVSRIKGRAFIFPIDFVTYTSTGSELGLFLATYTGTDDFVIESITICSDVTTVLARIYLGSGGSMTNTTAVTPVNANDNSKNAFSGTLTKGANNASLTGLTLADPGVVPAGGKFETTTQGAVILATNSQLAATVELPSGASSTKISAFILGHVAEKL